MGLLKRAKRLFKGLKERGGFTLPEVAAVVAITGTLAAVIVPVAVDQIEKGRTARAAQDVEGISGAINAFFRDTGEWPDRLGIDPDKYFVLRSGGVNATFDLFGTPTEGNVSDPDNGNTNWTNFATGTGLADAIVNHLTLDNPGNAGVSYRASGVDVNWQGPYLPQIFNDPWGRNYLVYARAFTTESVADIEESSPGAGDGVTGGDIFVWVISGGPNKALETDVTSPILNNKPDNTLSTTADDIGKMMFKAREALPGVASGS